MDRKPRSAELDDERKYGEPDDDIPEMTAEDFANAIPGHQFFAERGLPVPGRPKSADPKIAVSLRLDRAVVEAFKAGGPGWQTRMNAVLAESLSTPKR